MSAPDAEGAWYPPRRKLLMGTLADDDVRKWAARARAAMDVWLDWLAALLQLDGGVRYSRSLPISGRRRLLIGMGAETQAGHNKFVVKSGQSQRYFLSLLVMKAPTSTSLGGCKFT